MNFKSFYNYVFVLLFSVFIVTGCGGGGSSTTNDTIKPVITLNGANPMELTQGTAYSEAGATATDDRDGTVTVTISGSVDVNTVGSYTITYKAKDSTGNEATATRTVNVVLPPDTTKPVITLNSENNITLTQGTAYSEAGATATDDRDGNLTITVSGSVDVNTVGSYTVTYKATDSEGNEASVIRTVNVVLAPDTTSPVITLNGDSSIEWTQGTAYSDEGATATDDRDGNLTVTVTGSVDANTIGSYTLTYTVVDSAGNETVLTRTVDVVLPISKISGYVEDDPIPNASIKITNELGEVIVETTSDVNAKYELEAPFDEGKTYILESKGTLGDRNITMHSIFEFNQDTIVNVNPVTEIAYRLSQETTLTLKEINLKVLSYFGITNYSEAEKIRFLNTSKAHEGMKTFAKSEVPIDSVDAFKSDIENDLKNLQLLILDDLEIIASSESIEIGEAIKFSLNKEFTSDYNITWAGVDRNSDSPQLTSTYAGNREVAVKVTYDNKTILSSSTTVSFYKTGSKETVAVADNSIEQNSTINDITITIPKDSLPSGVTSIYVTEIDKGTSSVLKTLKLEPSGTVFTTPLTIRVPYDLSTVEDPSTLFIERLEEDGTIEILKPTIDYKQNELVFQTDHFSTFTITIEDGREYIDKYDIENELFDTDGEYSISLPGLDDTNMYELIKEAVDGDYLSDDMHKVVEEFYDEGYDWEIDGFDSNYEKSFRYVLAESVGKSDEYDSEPSLATKMIKYELLVDSLKKYRVAKLIDAYIDNDMLVEPYDNWGFGVTTRGDFFNEMFNVEQESYGLVDNKAFKLQSNVAYDTYKTVQGAKDFLSTTAKSIVEKGYSATGTKIAWDIIKEQVADDVKRELKEWLFGKRLTYLECLDVSSSDKYREYKIGDYPILRIYDDGEIVEEGYILEDLAYAFAGSANLDQIKYKFQQIADNNGISINTDEFLKSSSCILQKLNRKSESDYSTIETVKIIHESGKVRDIFKQLAEEISNKNVENHVEVLKIIHFNKEELKEYSKYLKTLAIANTAPIIADIVVEAELIDGESIEDIEGDDFFINDVAKQDALVKFETYYKERSLRSVKDESSETVKVYGLEAFKNLKLRIDEKYMDMFSLDVVKLDINYVALEKKIATDDISANYYKTLGTFKELNLKTIDVKIDDYTLNASTNKYEISLDELFKTIDISEIAYLDVKLGIRFTYNSKVYYLEKSFDFVADSSPDDVVTDEVERGSFTVTVKDESSNLLSDVKVSVGEKECTTSSTGECTIEELIPSEYKISLIKDGYFPEYKDSFIDVASTKDIEFTLKEYDTTAEMVLDVVGVRSEVNPMEYKFYINALGSNLDLNISFGDGAELVGSLSYLLGDDNYITHEYTSKGLKTVNVNVSNEEGYLEKTLNAYPIDSDKIVDVVFLVDLSGSYGSSLSNFKSKATEIAEGFSTLGSDTRVGLASFDEFPSYADSDDFAYNEDKELTYDFEAFNYAVNQMELKWGGDSPESQLEGLYQIATTFNWNDKSEKFIFIATDASFHNSDIEEDYPGHGYTETLQALKDKGITVIGLNRGGDDIDDVTTITNATGGTVFYLDSSSSDIVEQIMNFSESANIESRSIIRKRLSPHIIGSIIQGNRN